MRQISVLQVLGAIVVLVLVVAPASGRTFYSHNDGTAEEAIYGQRAGDEIAVSFTNTDPDSIVGVRFYIRPETQIPTSFQVMITDASPSAPSGPWNDIMDWIQVNASQTGFTDYQRVHTKAEIGSMFFVIAKFQTPGEPKIGVDTTYAPAGKLNTWSYSFEDNTWTRLSELPGTPNGVGMIDVLAGLMGDLNGDRRIDTGDALYAIDLFLGKSPTPEDTFLGDVNGDKVVDIQDATVFIDIFLGRRTRADLP